MWNADGPFLPPLPPEVFAQAQTLPLFPNRASGMA